MGIYHQFPKRSLDAGQVHCAVHGPNPGLQVRGKCLDINASRTIADENYSNFEDSPRRIVNILLLIVVFPKVASVYRYHIRSPNVEALPMCVV